MTDSCGLSCGVTFGCNDSWFDGYWETKMINEKKRNDTDKQTFNQ